MDIIFLIILSIIIFNTLAAIVTVFTTKRDIAATWAWLLVLILFPVGGFIAYLFVGKKISSYKIYNLKSEEQAGFDKIVNIQKIEWASRKLLGDHVELKEAIRETIKLFFDLDDSILTQNNQVELFTDGHRLFERIFADIDRAQESIHLEYYAILDDNLGHILLRHLVGAAKRGVKVKVLYDSLGSRGTHHSFFKPLEAVGGEAEPFLGHKKAIVHSPRLNYRDHRKIIVMDGHVGYIGGFNVGDEYVGENLRFGYWRDTHLRIHGNAVWALQSRFLMDWNATVKRVRNREMITYSEKLFPIMQTKGTTKMQIVSSGPGNITQNIKLGYLKLINTAREYIYIQTPYLIPDDSVLEALSIAALSGIKVKIMIPCKPDHAFVYRATQYYAKQLLKMGVEIYQYENGFLHAKTFVVDGEVCSVGSANVDFRSFKLNFEANAFIYDENIAQSLHDVYEQDILNCLKLTPEYFDEQSNWMKFKQYFSRLLSPIL